ncbi:hydroxyisourate hydrolase [Alphaproteobacteria bacterium]|nr:hydroxyisourate hydrolase [Alphaproteobacteria bacterium]
MSNGYLTTHVLDVFNGTPGRGIRGKIFRIEKEKKEKIKEFKLNNDGRSDSPILKKEEFAVGKYELIFYCGEYFKNYTTIKEPLFIDDVVIRFGINDPDQHYHVPLLVSPWSYSTYRGS